MTSADLLPALCATTVSGSAAILLVMALRRPVLRAFDAGVAYLLWVLVPLVIGAVLLPAFPVPSVAAPVLVLAKLPAIAALMRPVRGTESLYFIPLLFALWAIGTALSALLFVRRQLRFERALGRLQALDDGTYLAETSVGLPAVIGILRPRIVLPADHAARFDAQQLVLVRAHEYVHVMRGDQLANLLAMTLRCLFWFNPLLQWAAPRFRHDQELACDARVVARHPQARRAYGEALLHAQVAAASAPLSCQIGFGHPLKERIAMLKQSPASLPRRVAGITLMSLFVACAGCAANVTRSANAPPDTQPKMQGLPPLPVYPANAKAQGVAGLVRLKLHIAADGSVRKVTVTSSEPAGVFDASAVEMARKMQFEPATRRGKPVAADLVLPVKFALSD